VLIGDPGQLTAIEAGAVLRDIVGPAADRLLVSPVMREVLSSVVGQPIPAAEPPAGVTFGDGIVTLERVHRFGEAIAGVADAIRRGDDDAVVESLGSASASAEVSWLAVDAATAAPDLVRGAAIDAGRSLINAARAGDAVRALSALGSFRVLCAHRRGPHGVATWTTAIERWLTAAIDDFDAVERDYVGRPLLVTQNDYELRVFNGDAGVVVAEESGGVSAVFDTGGELLRFTPTRLAAVETVYAMTIHKSQGSQFETAVVVLPDESSRILTRELLYTAVTRARRRLILVGTEGTVRAAVRRPVARASGLRERLWGS
jgi:exodeoxyribonuclease V alpha subunit